MPRCRSTRRDHRHDRPPRSRHSRCGPAMDKAIRPAWLCEHDSGVRGHGARRGGDRARGRRDGARAADVVPAERALRTHGHAGGRRRTTRTRRTRRRVDLHADGARDGLHVVANVFQDGLALRRRAQQVATVLDDLANEKTLRVSFETRRHVSVPRQHRRPARAALHRAGAHRALHCAQRRGRGRTPPVRCRERLRRSAKARKVA